MQAAYSNIDALAARMTTIENRQLAIIVKLDDLASRLAAIESRAKAQKPQPAKV